MSCVCCPLGLRDESHLAVLQALVNATRRQRWTKLSFMTPQVSDCLHDSAYLKIKVILMQYKLHKGAFSSVRKPVLQ